MTWSLFVCPLSSPSSFLLLHPQISFKLRSVESIFEATARDPTLIVASLTLLIIFKWIQEMAWSLFVWISWREDVLVIHAGTFILLLIFRPNSSPGLATPLLLLLPPNQAVLFPLQPLLHPFCPTSCLNIWPTIEVPSDFESRGEKRQRRRMNPECNTRLHILLLSIITS